MMKTDVLQNRFTTLIAAIDQALDKVEQGKKIDLSHLGREVDMLCEDAKKGGPEVITIVKPLMAELIARLDALTIALTELKKKFLNGH